MKLKLLLLTSLLVSTLLAQNDDAPPTFEEAPPQDWPAPEAQNDPEKTYEMFDIAKAPSFPGGEQAMMQFISDNLKYPALARENAIQGMVALTFVVDKDGSVTNINILRDIGGGCGKEAMRVVQAMPKWTPGQANGQPVKVRYTLPIRYKLEGADPPSLPPPANETGTVSEDEVWKMVAEGAQRTQTTKGIPERNTPFEYKRVNEKTFLLLLETNFKVKLSTADINGFKTLGEISDYFYRAQFAPEFYTKEGMRGKYAKILTDRADFDLNSDGLGKIASLIIPKGCQVVLFSKKGFKGKKLKIDATTMEITISQMSAVLNIKDKKGVLKGDTSTNWEMNTRSIKIILPKGFPVGQ
jgi:TonB family protein